MKERRVATLVSSQTEGDGLQSLEDGSDGQRQWLRSRRQEEKQVVSDHFQRDEKQDPALNRWGHESDAVIRMCFNVF